MIATIAHLDGTTAVTVLITIPAMYPVYKKMKIDQRILLCLTGACMGVMNLLPWGGPTARAATVLEMDAKEKKEAEDLRKSNKYLIFNSLYYGWLRGNTGSHGKRGRGLYRSRF